MESILLKFASIALVFSAVYLGMRALTNSLKRKQSVLASQGERLTGANLIRLTLSNGVNWLKPVAVFFNRFAPVHAFGNRLVRLCALRGCITTNASVLSALGAVLLVVFCCVFIVAGSIVAACAATLCVLVVSVVVVGNYEDRRKEALREEVPAVLELMSMCFSSGFTLLQTFQQVAKEIPGYLGELFGRAAHVLETGGTTASALEVLRDGANSAELAFVVAALDVQHESGGALHQVLDTAADSIKGELGLKRSLRVQTAQAKLSARIVIVMPFLLIALFSLISPGFLNPFFGSVLGWGLLALAFVMQGCGIYLVHRALSIEGIS